MRAHCHVAEAFDSDGTDIVTVGSDANPDAIVTDIDVSSTGIKTCSLGANGGYNESAQPLKIFYTAGGTAPTTGEALIILETVKTPGKPT